MEQDAEASCFLSVNFGCAPTESMAFPLNRLRKVSYNCLITKEEAGDMREMRWTWLAVLLMALAIVVFINIASFL